MRKKVHHIEYRNESKEELLPDFSPDFPYISSCTELDQCLEGIIPWHWHKEVELFYMESGSLEYYTPGGVLVFPAGSGGLINSNVLHMTKIHEKGRPVAQLLHIFDPSLVGGRQGSRIEQKYVAPIVTSSQLEAIPLSPDVPEHGPVLEALRSPSRSPTANTPTRSGCAAPCLRSGRTCLPWQNPCCGRKQDTTRPMIRSKP